MRRMLMRPSSRSTGTEAGWTTIGRQGPGPKRQIVAERLWMVGLLAGLAVILGCNHPESSVALYAAQDRVFAEPILREFRSQSGIDVRALYDSEATKTVGLANRLIAESGRPQAEIWWSNEEMRTRQLASRGVLEKGWQTFGERRRVWVVRTGSSEWQGKTPRLSWLTNAEWKGRFAMAYPVFGSTTTHWLALRQRWGEGAWKNWCQALAANRPFVVDGNSVVVQLVARGDAVLGLTDSDDVAFARREGLGVEAIPMLDGEGLVIPNTVAFVSGRQRSAASSNLLTFLSGDTVRERMVAAGALNEVHRTPTDGNESLTEGEWERLLMEFDASVTWLKEAFVR